MNTGRVKAAAKVIVAAQKQGRITASGWAYALESAQLLMSPELAAELAGLRARDVLLHTILDGWRSGRLTAEQVALGLQSTLEPESVPQPDAAS